MDSITVIKFHYIFITTELNSGIKVMMAMELAETALRY